MRARVYLEGTDSYARPPLLLSPISRAPLHLIFACARSPAPSTAQARELRDARGQLASGTGGASGSGTAAARATATAGRGGSTTSAASTTTGGGGGDDSSPGARLASQLFRAMAAEKAALQRRLSRMESAGATPAPPMSLLPPTAHLHRSLSSRIAAGFSLSSSPTSHPGSSPRKGPLPTSGAPSSVPEDAVASEGALGSWATASGGGSGRFSSGLASHHMAPPMTRRSSDPAPRAQSPSDDARGQESTSSAAAPGTSPSAAGESTRGCLVAAAAAASARDEPRHSYDVDEVMAILEGLGEPGGTGGVPAMGQPGGRGHLNRGVGVSVPGGGVGSQGRVSSGSNGSGSGVMSLVYGGGMDGGGSPGGNGNGAFALGGGQRPSPGRGSPLVGGKGGAARSLTPYMAVARAKQRSADGGGGGGARGW